MIMSTFMTLYIGVGLGLVCVIMPLALLVVFTMLFKGRCCGRMQKKDVVLVH